MKKYFHNAICLKEFCYYEGTFYKLYNEEIHKITVTVGIVWKLN